MSVPRAAQPFDIPTHTPDTPFGCAAQWGPPIGAFYSDLVLHVCNEGDQHEGEHTCKCGTTATNLGGYPRHETP